MQIKHNTFTILVTLFLVSACWFSITCMALLNLSPTLAPGIIKLMIALPVYLRNGVQ